MSEHTYAHHVKDQYVYLNTTMSSGPRNMYRFTAELVSGSTVMFTKTVYGYADDNKETVEMCKARCIRLLWVDVDDFIGQARQQTINTGFGAP